MPELSFQTEQLNGARTAMQRNHSLVAAAKAHPATRQVDDGVPQWRRLWGALPAYPACRWCAVGMLNNTTVSGTHPRDTHAPEGALVIMT